MKLPPAHQQLRGQIQVPACGEGRYSLVVTLSLWQQSLRTRSRLSTAHPRVAGEEGRQLRLPQHAGSVQQGDRESDCEFAECPISLILLLTQLACEHQHRLDHELYGPTNSCSRTCGFSQLPGARQVPGTGLPLEERYKLRLLRDWFTPTGRDRQTLLSLAACIHR